MLRVFKEELVPWETSILMRNPKYRVQDRVEKHQAIILEELFRRVGEKMLYRDFDFNQKFWFEEFSWTWAEQEDFKDWLVEYLKNSMEARQEVMGHATTRYKFVERFAGGFVFMYGWKLRMPE